MISVNSILGHYAPKQIETLIIHDHADTNKYIWESQNLDQVVLNKTCQTVTSFTCNLKVFSDHFCDLH